MGTIIPAQNPIERSGDSFRFYVPGGYTSIHYATCGGNCKMCTVSDVGMNLETQEEATFERLDELFGVYRKLIFQVNVSKKEHIEILKKHFTMVGVSIIPIGYNRPTQQHDKLTYVATFLTNNTFSSNGVTKELVKERMEDPEIKRRIKNQTISLKKAK